MFLFMLLATFSLASAQTIDIKGTVIDEKGEPVIGASVMIKGTLKGDITDVSGRFSLGGVKTTDKLAVSCIGMIPVEIDPQAEMRITLKTDHEQLDEVLVVAFGQQTKSSFTGSAAVVKSETLEKKQLTNVMSGLQGQVAGLQMINNSGSPTATPSMAIRGFSSINAGTSPLIIVDGSPYDGGWNNLNPNDVENITVLKDAASNALYGARGANGWIQLYTATSGSDYYSQFNGDKSKGGSVWFYSYKTDGYPEFTWTGDGGSLIDDLVGTYSQNSTGSQIFDGSNWVDFTSTNDVVIEKIDDNTVSVTGLLYEDNTLKASVDAEAKTLTFEPQTWLDWYVFCVYDSPTTSVVATIADGVITMSNWTAYSQYSNLLQKAAALAERACRW